MEHSKKTSVIIYLKSFEFQIVESVHDSTHHVLLPVHQPAGRQHVQRDDPPQPEGLALAAAGGVPGVPATEVHTVRRGVQVRTSSSQCGGPEREGDSLLRQY